MFFLLFFILAESGGFTILEERYWFYDNNLFPRNDCYARTSASLLNCLNKKLGQMGFLNQTL